MKVKYAIIDQNQYDKSTLVDVDTSGLTWLGTNFKSECQGFRGDLAIEHEGKGWTTHSGEFSRDYLMSYGVLILPEKAEPNPNEPQEIEYETKVVASLTRQQFTDLIITAFEGGSNYWMMIRDFIPDEDQYPECSSYSEMCAAHLWDSYWDEEGDDGIPVHDRETEEKLGTLTLGKVLETLKNYPDLSHDLQAQTYDAGTADEIMQYSVLNEIVYG